MKKWIWPLLVVLALGGGGYAWYYRQSHKPLENPYKTAPVERRSISSRVTASGTLQARVTVQVGSQVSGRVLELHADFNSKVKKGDLVAKLDPQLFQASLQQAQASYASAQANEAKAEATLVDANRQFERAKTQRAEGLASQQDVDTADTAARVAKAGVDAAKSMVAQARAALNQDQVNLSLTVIKSPIDGVVISRSVDVGQTVAASLQAPVLFTIAEDLTKMQVEVSVDEAVAPKVRAPSPYVAPVRAPKLIVCVALATVTVRVALPVPSPLVALIVTEYEPAAMGVPLITPVVVSMLVPGGRLVAPKLVGVLVAVI